MLKIEIKKNNQVSNSAEFKTQEELDEWFNYHKSIKAFGENEYSYESLVSEVVPAVYEDQEVLITPAVTEEQEILDENGLSFDPPQFQTVEITPAEYETQSVLVAPEIPAVYETINVPAEYEVTTTDITNLVAQDKINADAQEFLDSTDFKVLRHIRQKALNEPLSLTEEEYLSLEQQRSDAAARIVKL